MAWLFFHIYFRLNHCLNCKKNDRCKTTLIMFGVMPLVHLALYVVNENDGSFY